MSYSIVIKLVSYFFPVTDKFQVGIWEMLQRNMASDSNLAL